MRFCHYDLQVIVVVLEIITFVLGDDKQFSKWGVWTEWSGCSATCGYGVMKRERVWLEKVQRSESQTYKYEDIAECWTQKTCPIDGRWTFWGPWLECSKMCDTGTRLRYRECTNPKPQYEGKDCEGENFLEEECNMWECPPLPPNFDITSCNDTTYMCLSEEQCVPEANRCDDSLQCHDGSDEYRCEDYTNFNIGTRMYATLATLIFPAVLLLLAS